MNMGVRKEDEGVNHKKKFIKYFSAVGLLSVILLWNANSLACQAGDFVCGGGLHVMTNTSYQTYVTQYDHSSQYGTCHARIEEVKKVTRCQCGDLIAMETVSKRETHSQPH